MEAKVLGLQYELQYININILNLKHAALTTYIVPEIRILLWISECTKCQLYLKNHFCTFAIICFPINSAFISCNICDCMTGALRITQNVHELTTDFVAAMSKMYGRRMIGFNSNVQM